MNGLVLSKQRSHRKRWIDTLSVNSPAGIFRVKHQHMIKKEDMITGAVFYAAGDTVAAFISDEFSWLRLFGMAIIGGVLYAWEIPAYFGFINKLSAKYSGWKASVLRMFMAQVYFNPIWIFRHLAMIKLLMLSTALINKELLTIAWYSFLWNIPVSLFANYIIQNVIKEKYRFLANAIFSGMMAVYYALSATWFA
jgi:hypothetical protein